MLCKKQNKTKHKKNNKKFGLFLECDAAARHSFETFYETYPDTFVYRNQTVVMQMG